MNLRDVFKKHLASCDPRVVKTIHSMNSKKKSSSLPLSVKPLLLNPDPTMKFAMFVGNVDDFAYSDDENIEESEETDSEYDSDDAGWDENLEENAVSDESDEDEDENEDTVHFLFSQPTDASQSSGGSSQQVSTPSQTPESTPNLTLTPESSQDLIGNSQ